MADQVQYRRGTAAQHAGFTGAAGEITVDTTQNALRIHDGASAGGHQHKPALAQNALTGAAETYTAATLGTHVQRANAGSAMTDTGPSLSAMAGVPSGAEILIANIDASAALTISAGASTAWNGASSVVLTAGRSVLFIWDGISNFQPVQNGLSLMNGGAQTLSGAAGTIVLNYMQSCIAFDLSGGAGSLVLPPAGIANRRVHIVDFKGDAASNNLTITVSGGGAMSGQTTLTLSLAYAAIELLDNGTNWSIIGQWSS